MKQLILIASVLSFYSLRGFSQVSTTEEDGTVNMDNYIFIRPARVVLCDVDGLVDTAHPTYFDVPKGYKFQLVDLLDDGGAIIQFWEFDSTSKRTQVANKTLINTFNYTGGNITKPRFFKVSATDWQNKVTKRYSTNLIPKHLKDAWFTGTTITGGAIILPYKFRPKVDVDGVSKGFDFSKDITLGISGGFRHRISHYKPYYLNVLANFGISNVTQTPYNTDSTIKEIRDIPAFTVATGLVFDFKNIQFGVFLGWDKISDSDKSNWIYQNKPWVSIGFGYSIFSISTTQTTTTAGKN